MRVVKDLMQTNKKNLQKVAKEHNKVDEGDDTDEMIDVKAREWHYINEESSVFDSVMNKGINTEPGIFDKYAVFKTGSKDQIDY